MRVILNKKNLRFLIPIIISAIALTALVLVVISRLGSQRLRVYNLITTQDIDEVTMEYKPVSDQELLPGFTIAAQDETSALLISKKTANVAFYNKQSDKLYYTALPEEAIKKAKPASETTKSRMMSQLSLKLCEKDGTYVDINSYDMCIVNGNFGIKNVDNGVEISYLLGEVEQERLLPKGLKEKRFSEIIDKIPPSDQSEFKKRYFKVDIKSESEQDRKKLLDEYPAAKDEVIYVLRQGLEDFILNRVEKIIIATGYTMEQKLSDEKFYTDTLEINLPPLIKVVVNYVLDNGEMVVSIDKGKIKHTKDSIPLEITLLEYFFSAGNEEEGYMLVPDGSGSIINLNNGKNKKSIYKTQVYGMDSSTQPILQTENNIPAPIPVFGLKMKESALFAQIEEGDALASIYADVSGRVDQLNRVYPVFKLREQNNELVFLDYTSAGGGTVYANRIQAGELSGKLSIRYTVLIGVNQGYSDMASLLRNRLVKQNILREKENTEIPLLIDVIGAIDIVKPVFGIPQEKVVCLTSYEKAKQIAEYFRLNQVDKLIVKYVGGFKGGIKHSALDKFRAESCLGSTKQMNKVFDWFNKNNIGLYMDASFTYVPDNSLFDSFHASEDSIRVLNNKRGRIFDVDMPTFYYASEPKFAIKPSLTPSYMNKFSKSLKKYGLGLSVRDMGNSILSDFSASEPIFRDQSQEYYAQAMQTAVKNGTNLLMNGANMYTLPYTQLISRMPSQSNQYEITDQSVPFYQMVIHGYCDYVYSPINLSEDYRRNLLKAIETGAGIYGAMYYDSSVMLKETSYSYYYASNFERQKKSVVKAYNEVKNALKPVYGSKIIEHSQLAQEVFITEYDNGNAIIVNYGKDEFAQGNIRVGAMDYLLIGDD